jgi:Plant transposon protein
MTNSLWIWDVFFGCPGSFNDVNILNCSPIFADVLAGNLPPSQHLAQNRDF